MKIIRAILSFFMKLIGTKKLTPKKAIKPKAKLYKLTYFKNNKPVDTKVIRA